MRDATDRQLKEWGWKWALRNGDRVVAVTISVFDAVRWEEDGIGKVVALDQVERDE